MDIGYQNTVCWINPFHEWTIFLVQEDKPVLLRIYFCIKETVHNSLHGYDTWGVPPFPWSLYASTMKGLLNLKHFHLKNKGLA